MCSSFAGTRLGPLPTRPACRQALGHRHRSTITAVLEDTVSQPDARYRPETEISSPSSSIKPGDADRTRFDIHWSVDMWKYFYPRRWLDTLTDESSPIYDRMQNFANTLTSAVSTAGVFDTSENARYWGYHLTRSGFFITQGILGLLASRISSSSTGDAPGGSTFGRLTEVLRGGWAGPMGEALLTYYQDSEMIKEGKYAMPWDMSPGHRQFNPLFVLSRGARFIQEAAETLNRRDKGTPDEVWLRSAFLPDYFQKTFHYQTDGWLSQWSAGVYETSTETLFIGRQDAAQRTTLVHLSNYLKGKDVKGMKSLEIASGTGRFATFVKDNYPNLRLTVSDLSPFYLQEARQNVKYWKGFRAPNSSLGGVDDAGVDFLQAAAEDLPVEDGSYDIVYCIYLFHELPADVRRKVISEMARVVKPGGLVVLTDSTQLGDRDALDATIQNFGGFNEPYYLDYLNTDLGGLFEDAGLKCGLKVVSSTTKSLCFFKDSPQTESSEPSPPLYTETGDPNLN